MHSQSKMYLWWEYVLFYLTFPEVGEHSHYTMQLTIALDGVFEIRLGDGNYSRQQAHLVNSDIPHALRLPDGHVAVLTFFPESPAGQEVKRRFLEKQDEAEIPWPKVKPFIESLKSTGQEDLSLEEAQKIYQELINNVLEGNFPLGFERTIDPRVRRAFDYIVQSPMKDIPLEEIAKEVHLSPSRFRHLFKEKMGKDFRHMQMAARFVEALKRANTDSNLTQIAHETGFTDLAHMTRVFKRVGGLTPSSYINSRKYLKVIHD